MNRGKTEHLLCEGTDFQPKKMDSFRQRMMGQEIYSLQFSSDGKVGIVEVEIMAEVSILHSPMQENLPKTPKEVGNLEIQFVHGLLTFRFMEADSPWFRDFLRN